MILTKDKQGYIDITLLERKQRANGTQHVFS